jgi:integrase
MPRLKKQLPKYSLHKSSGQAVVRIDGKMHYLGPHGSPESREKYQRLIDRIQARRKKKNRRPAATPPPPVPRGADLLIKNLAAEFLRSGVEDISPSELSFVKNCLRQLVKHYADRAAVDFGPLALQDLRDRIIRETGNSRGVVNRKIRRLQNIFRWAVSKELIPETVYRTLATVAPLRRNRFQAPETAPVRPVSDAHVNAILPYVSAPGRALIRLQWLTGARAGELVTMRPCDVDIDGEVWIFTPEHHKTEHHGHLRQIDLGPQSQAILKPFLNRPLDVFLFSPAESAEEHRRRRHEARTTPESCGNRPGTNRRSRPLRVPAACYTVDSYRRAITRACDRAFPPPPHLARRSGESAAAWEKRLTPEQRSELKAWRKKHRWHPHQLRHAAATRRRKTHGVEAARAVLGHHSIKMTELYAEQDRELLRKIVTEVG